MSKKQCQAKTRRGEPCNAAANESGFCFTHDAINGKERALMPTNEQLQKTALVVRENNLMLKRTPTRQQAKFIENMANPEIKSQTEAAIKAGCPPKNARITASKWLTKSNICSAIQERKQRALAHAEVTAQEVLGSAAFQMRSSMADVLDDEGSFDYQKAKDTGAVDLLKKHKETIRQLRDSKGQVTETIKTVEIEMLTNESARKDVAAYIGLQQFAPAQQSRIEKLAYAARTVSERNGVSVEEVLTIMIEYERIPAELIDEVTRVALSDGK